MSQDGQALPNEDWAKMKDIDYSFPADEEAEDEEALQELKKANKARHKSFAAVINRKKLSRYELEEVMV